MMPGQQAQQSCLLIHWTQLCRALKEYSKLWVQIILVWSSHSSQRDDMKFSFFVLSIPTKKQASSKLLKCVWALQNFNRILAFRFSAREFLFVELEMKYFWTTLHTNVPMSHQFLKSVKSTQSYVSLYTGKYTLRTHFELMRAAESAHTSNPN